MSKTVRVTKQRSNRLRGKLLRGSSVAAIVTAIGLSHAHAQSLSQLKAVVGVNNEVTARLLKNPNINQEAAEAAGMSAATARALHYQAQVAQALALAQQAQNAARQAVLGTTGNVPNGLVIGGLQEVPDPLPAARDSTGTSTWQGAAQPTETKSGNNVTVTIKQTQQRAILSWETFNVGQNTTVDFEQTFKGVAEKSWIALNRVVGNSSSPAEILGSIKAQGTVLIIDQNGILFGGASQVNVNALIASSLEIGHALDPNNNYAPLTIKDRNDYFLEYGLLGYADQATTQAEQSEEYTFSTTATCEVQGGCNQGNVTWDTTNGGVQVNAGANITANSGGYILLTGPEVVNSGQLTAPLGQVSLEAGEQITMTRSTGALGSATPDIRGFSLASSNQVLGNPAPPPNYVENTGIISSPQGYVSLETNNTGGVINEGILEATTSVSRNGFVQLDGADIQLAADSTIAIGPDPTAETIPQDPVSLEDFKPSKVVIGDSQSQVEIQHNAMIYAPSGDVTIGLTAGADTQNDGGETQTLSRIFMDTDAVIDVAGLPDVTVPGSLNSIAIHPVTQNTLQDDSKAEKNSFLNGATIYVDPRLSGVRSDGVAWVGSPLVPAASYYQQVGINVRQLMTAGGNVTLGVQSYANTNPQLASDVTIKSGAVIDLDGGWVTYQAGWVKTTELVDASGNIVNVADADPNDTYVGIYNGFTSVQSRWGVVQTWSDPLLNQGQYEPSYTEGRDAGSLTLKSSVVVLDGTVYAHAFPGPMQLQEAQVGTGKSSVYGDGRNVQAAPSQLPVGGFLFVQALADDSQNAQVVDGGGDINIVNQADYQALPSNFEYGQSISIVNGQLVIPTRAADSYLPANRLDTITLSANALSNMGLDDLALATSGEVNVEQGADLTLSPGGAFNVVAGRAITVDGSVYVPSGNISLQTVSLEANGNFTGAGGSVFTQENAVLGAFDININGILSTRGLWTNDYGAAPGQILGSAYTNGGSITLNAAPSVLQYQEVNQGNGGQQVNEDISGSILINKGALLDVSGGGYVSPLGIVDLSATGGNVSLIDETSYFQTTAINGLAQSAIPGFRVNGINISGQSGNYLPSNPGSINARISIAPGTIEAYGFGGGGTFTLDTPAISFGDGTATSGTELPLDFFSQAGFANYDITTYKTDLIANQFDNGYGGYNAVLATDVLTIKSGQTLDLSQSYLALDLNNPARADAQLEALQSLATGGNIESIVKPNIPSDMWDQKAVNLTLGGLIELKIDKGGKLLDAPGGILTVSQLDNEGTIRIPGGTIDQTEILPQVYGSQGLGVYNIGSVFSANANGSIDENALDYAAYENYGIQCNGGPCTNDYVAITYDIYLLGSMPGNVGIHLGAGSVTDLSGISVRNPRAEAPGMPHFVTGTLYGGGTLESQPNYFESTPLFEQTLGGGVYGLQNAAANDPQGERMAEQVVADPGSLLNISGASDTYDEAGPDGTFVPTRVWSNGGTLYLGSGGTITGATILAQGGAPDALGGTLEMLDPIFYQNDPSTPTQDAVSEQQIADAGFSTFVAQGSITSSGDATISLSRAFFLTSISYNGIGGSIDNNQNYVPDVGSGGVLTIEAPYIGLDSVEQTSAAPGGNQPLNNSVIFRADDIDIEGAIEFDDTVGNVVFDATGDVRLIGVQPANITDNVIGTSDVADTLQGQLSVYNDLTINAAQVYPTTGSTFSITSLSPTGTITFGRTTKATPDTPYSAGADLTIQADNIVLGGVIRVPIGTLTIGSDTATDLAPATNSVTALSGSITSVSADGLGIPYGITTDQAEWYFGPTNLSELTAPPAAVLNIAGNSVTLNSGATVDMSGGGDLYAYEFIPGTGGSRDVLNYNNPNEFSGNGGYLYPGAEQVYAIVPGLSSGVVAPYDPIYSANYGSLYSASAVGQSVYLTGGDGIKAGWYTLLPAQYAMLPGGMRIVQDENAAQIAPGTSDRLNDGTILMSGYYGVAGTDSRSSTPVSFEVQSQSTFEQYSQIALTSADMFFAQLAAKDAVTTPRLPLDAGRLMLAPTADLVANATFLTTPAPGGRGSEADISGEGFDIVSTLNDAPPPGEIEITATTLDDLNASSLLIGGTRTDNSDGTTSITVTAGSITVANDSGHPLTAPEIILVGSTGITLDNGATIIAKGNPDLPQGGNYVIDGSAAALLRVSNGPQRLATLPVSDAFITVGDADLEGSAILLESGGNLTVSPVADIVAKYLAVGAGQVTFASSGQGLSGLVITPQLQALFSKAEQLTILSQNTIAFASGTYDFGNVAFDAQGFSLLNGNAVTLNADTLTLNGASGNTQCGQANALACGDGILNIDAQKINFGWGNFNTYGFGRSVTLAAPMGMFMVGKGSFDFGPAALTLETPYVGDAGYTPAAGVNEIIPSVALTTTGSVTIDNPTGASIPDVLGVPGASLTIAGNGISVNNTELRATAGTLTLNSQSGIDITGDAIVEAPSYAKTFGDSADPVSVSAPGGTLALIAQNGNVDAASGTTISVGGNSGMAGTLSLSAANGSFNLDGTIDATAPDGGGSLILSTGGAFDLAAFSTGFAKDFSGTIDITSGTGNLVLADGDELKAQNVLLDAEGGTVDIGGTIDVSGTNGGTVDLYGIKGVTLESTALIDAHANGYGRLDPRQAHGGTVDIGTDQNGAVTVKSGATIDVAALQTMARLVPMTMNGTTYYEFVPGDTGGTVDFRLPVIDGQDGETVNMTYAGNIEGASAIDLVGFQRWNLANIANDPNFVGVTIVNGQAVLNVGAQAGQGQANFLADDAAGTVVNFIQNFNISADYKNLGGLASQSNFNARPGVELDYSGDIVLNSNWNLGAGTVDIAAAVKAGLMLPVIPGCTSNCQYYVIPGDEGEVFSKYTSLTYRVGGSVLGEPAVLTLRAGGNLDINGSITDGFFQFGDQNDQYYLNQALGGGNANGNRYYIPFLIPQCEGGANVGACDSGLGNWMSGSLAQEYVDLFFPGANGFKFQATVSNPIPYNPAANSPTANGGSGDVTNGDALASMQVFPLVTTANGTHYVQSTSYQLVAGADLTGADGGPSADPLRTVAGTDDSVVVDGINTYSYSEQGAATNVWADQIDFQVGGQILTADSWYMAFLTQNPQANASSYTYIDFSKAPSGVLTWLNANKNWYENFFKNYQGDYSTFSKGGEVVGFSTTLNIANLFLLDFIEPNAGTILNGNYAVPPKASVASCNSGACTAIYETLVRTGTGSIEMAASGDINLQNGANPTYEQLNSGDELQLGGSPVYTVGHLVNLTEQTVVDELTGQTFTIDPSNFDDTSDIFSQPIDNGNGYQYGASNGINDTGFAGIMIANPVYLTGGGSISLTAGNDILSRRDVWGEALLAENYNNGSTFYSWIGSGDQGWRVGNVGDVTNIMINPQLFTDGVGALGGGDINISAGHNIDDLTVVDDTSVTTASVTSRATLPTLGIWQFGGGNVTIAAGNDILGGRFDIGEGSMDVTAGGDIASDGIIQVYNNNGTSYTMPNSLRLRLSDATISVSAPGSIDVEGIAALGVYSEGGTYLDQENLNSHGFYSSIAGVSLLSDASVEIENQSPFIPLAGISGPFDYSIVSNADAAANGISSAVYPGSLSVAALTGSLDIVGSYVKNSLANNGQSLQADEIVLYPSPVGQLDLYAGANIAPVTIDMEDGDPGLLPGIFSLFSYNDVQGIGSGRTFNFPGVLPNTDQATRQEYHNATPTHLNDPYPVRIDAGGDILDMIINVPKQARIWAGQDIINMMFFGQNLLPTDITRIVAGRDITATTELVAPYEGGSSYGTPEAAVEGNDFIIGGPGSFFIEAGRDMGPFLNSADTNGFANNGATGQLSFAGGIIAVGNDWNPSLAPASANLYVMFGIAKGADYNALIDYYLDPSNLSNLPSYLFQQVTTASGNTEPDRSKPVYAPVLINWMKRNAAAALKSDYGTTNVSYQQAYDAFIKLPGLEQQIFLLDNIYFNELAQTSVPTSGSYENYSRGYIAVNLLFPASLGYTANNLGGGSNGANKLVETGNLDLRLSTIETVWGGNIYILGPGGRALIGSTVATSAQAALHTQVAGQLYDGIPIQPGGDVINGDPLPPGVPDPSTITDIPAGYEGVLTLRGGSIDTFTDEDFLLNQSRLFTEGGGNIIMWSSNGSLNAGQGPQTSSNFPPIVVQTDEDAYSFVDSSGAVTGAGIAAFQPAPGVAAPDVFLIAPRGTVDAGAAGVRVAGNLFVAAFQVANSSNFTVSGTTVGVPGSASVNVAAETSGSTAAAAASQMAQAVSGASNNNGTDESVITVDVLGYAGGGDTSGDEETRKRKR